MDTKFIFVTGGVVSSLGKGIAASSIGLLLKSRGLKVFMMKFDPYLNVDPGTMSPYQHGEVYVTKDGGETDLDIGHYERWLDANLTKESSVTSGKIYSSVIEKERRGDYLGACIQVIPHVTNEIKLRLKRAAEVSKADVVIAEVGGTVGDIESLPFLEAIRQARLDYGYQNTFYIHNTLVPYLRTSEESKTKPTQHSVHELLGLGIQPDAIILRSEVPLADDVKDKVSLFCNVPKEGVYEADDLPLVYELPLYLHAQHIDDFILNHFGIKAAEADLHPWINWIRTIKSLSRHIKIALVGKYVELHDAYLSVKSALTHAGYANNVIVDIDWVSAMDLNEGNVKDRLAGADGILIPGGFGERGSEGKKTAIRYARVNNVPLLGICFGMQLALIEYAEHVLNLPKANSTEFDPETPDPIIDFLHDQYQGIKMGGTLRLGQYDCQLTPGSLAYKCYGTDLIKERHRHRYEFNNKYKDLYMASKMKITGINPGSGLAEIVELQDHPFFICCQFHPEFSSRPLHPNPLFREFIKASIPQKD